MTLEEQLDRLIERWERGASLDPIASDEIEARLAAAETFVQLQSIEVPPAFAVRLEARVRAHVRSLAVQQGRVIAVPRSEAQRGGCQRTEKKRKRGAGPHAMHR